MNESIDREMKILVLNNGYLTDVPSGGDKHLLDLGEELSSRSKVTIILPQFATQLVANGIRIRSYWSWRPRSVCGIIFSYLFRAISASWLALLEKADIVLSSSGPIDILPALLNRWKCGACVVVYPFHLVPRRKAGSFVKKFQYSVSLLAQEIALLMMRRADVVFTDNSIVKNELASHGIPPWRIHVQRPVVNVEQVRNAPALRQYQVLFIGRMVRNKGIYDLVSALQKVPVTAGIIGDGEERISLQEHVKALGISDRVKVLGALPFDKMYSLLRGCDLFVFPSYEEGYGIAVAEAIAAGKPVIAYDLAHYGEVFNESLITVPIGDVSKLSEKIGDFFEKRIDVDAICQKYQGVRLASKADAADYEMNIILRARG
ncbi:MAG: glycosyltransferase family 4 protein [bacterium]